MATGSESRDLSVWSCADRKGLIPSVTSTMGNAASSGDAVPSDDEEPLMEVSVCSIVSYLVGALREGKLPNRDIISLREV